MGLDCSHDAFHGAYSAFNRLRKMVAKATGGSFPPHDDDPRWENPDWWYVGDDYPKEAHPGLWEFLGHSDCDGEISPEMCAKVADELEALLPEIERLQPAGETHGHIAGQGGYAAVTRKFIAGCRAAAAEGVPLDFH